MNQPTPHDDLTAVLRKLGVPVADALAEGDHGFPVEVPLQQGGSLVVELAEPALLGALDPDEVGMALLDGAGYAMKTWGLANRLPYFSAGESALLTEIGPMIGPAADGYPGSMYLDGYRFFVGPIKTPGAQHVLVLTINASEEKRIRHIAGKSGRSAHVLKRVGKALSMDQRMQHLCVSAVHEVASASELAAVLLWTVDAQSGLMRLSGSTGANRQGTAALSELEAEGGTSCIAELVASTHQSFVIPSVHEHVMTADLEGKFCYLKPAGLSVLPLVIGDRLLGVLELIGRDGDDAFLENQELFQTLAEHLALALNSAMLFENFERLASHDALTGIANHRSMQDFLHKRLAESARSGLEIGVVMLDVDHFRRFNEEEGHDAGDQVLRLVADALRDSVRPYDLAARYGGEEFTVVMPGSNRSGTIATAERIRRAIERISIRTRSGSEQHVTVSLGCAFYPGTADEAGALLKAADIALFEAKRLGRNRVCCYEGRFEGELRLEDIDLAKIWQWVPRSERAASERLLRVAEPFMEQIALALRLSGSQQQILRALAIVQRTYAQLAEKANSTKVREMERADEFRLLLPSLHAMRERFDGQGPAGLPGERIPLLARVLRVVLALAQDRGRPLVEDPGAYDPEIVAAVSELADAA